LSINAIEGTPVRGAFLFPRSREFLWKMRALVAWWWALAAFALLAALARNYADNVGFPHHGSGLEGALPGGLPSIWLQQHVYTLWPAGLSWAVVVVHASWFVVPWLVPLALTFRRPDRFGSMCRWWMALQVICLACFVLFPVRPPWMANADVTRILAVRLGADVKDANPVAAMPSLHVALPLVLSFWMFKEGWRLPARLMLVYSAVVALEVVFSGEHYVVDIAGAVAAAGLVALFARVDYRRLFSRLSSLRLSRPALAGPGRLNPTLETRTSGRKERGQVLIEMILVLPLIFVFILVLVDFGIALDRRETIQHGIREGARAGAVGKTVAEIKDTTSKQSGVLSTSQVSVCYVDADGSGFLGNAGDSVRVKASYTYKFSEGGGEMLTFFKVPVPSITMQPFAEARLETSVTGATAC